MSCMTSNDLCTRVLCGDLPVSTSLQVTCSTTGRSSAAILRAWNNDPVALERRTWGSYKQDHAQSVTLLFIVNIHQCIFSFLMIFHAALNKQFNLINSLFVQKHRKLDTPSSQCFLSVHYKLDMPSYQCCSEV